MGLGDSLQRSEVVERGTHKTWYQGPKTGLDFRVCGGRQGSNRPAVKRFFEDDYFGSFNSLVMAKLAGDLDGGLVGLKPGAAEKCVGQPRNLCQTLAQFLLQRYLVVIRTMNQPGDLILQCRHQFGVRMA